MKPLWTPSPPAPFDKKARVVKAAVLGAILTVFLALGPVSHHAMAHVGVVNQDGHAGGQCDGQVRIKRDVASCMSASIQNPPFKDMKIRATNHCAAYGDIIAHVDVRHNADRHMHLDDGSEKVYTGTSTMSARNVYCCLNKADKMCWKAQVEKNNNSYPGHIYRVAVSGNSYTTTWHPVRTHLERYNLCKDYPDQVYCKVNPDGDAFKTPESVCAATSSCNCGDHFCTTGDCDWHWKRSPAYEAMSADPAEPHCKELYTNYISASDGSSQTCDIRMKCWNGYRWSNGDPIITWAEARMNVWLIDDLRYCQPPANKPTDYGHLTTGSCPDNSDPGASRLDPDGGTGSLSGSSQ